MDGNMVSKFEDFFTLANLRKIMPKVPDADLWFVELANRMPLSGITEKDVVAQFIATVAYETNELTALDEKAAWGAKDLNKPAFWQSLCRVFPSKFPNVVLAESVSKKGIDAVFETAYGGRKDLGNTTPGYGARYTGRGCFHLTGYANYLTYTKYAQEATGDRSIDYVANPDLLLTPYHAVLTACLYWEKSGCHKLAVIPGNFQKVCVRVNGGTNGLEGRIRYYEKAKDVFR